jgi:hypothetical protein
VDEHVFAAGVRLDKPVTFGRVEPLHSSQCHDSFSNRESSIEDSKLPDQGDKKNPSADRQSLASKVPRLRCVCKSIADLADPNGCGFVIDERLVLDRKALISPIVGSSWGASLQVCHVSPEYPLRLLACV